MARPIDAATLTAGVTCYLSSFSPLSNSSLGTIVRDRVTAGLFAVISSYCMAGEIRKAKACGRSGTCHNA